MWGGKAFLHRKNDGFSPLDKVGAPSSDQSDPVAALFFIGYEFAVTENTVFVVLVQRR